VCVYLSNSKLDYPYTRSKQINKPRRFLVDLLLQVDSIQNTIQTSLTPSRVLDANFKCDLLNQHVTSSLLLKLKHQLRSWSISKN